MYGIEICIILKNDIVRKQKIYIYTHNNRWLARCMHPIIGMCSRGIRI